MVYKSREIYMCRSRGGGGGAGGPDPIPQYNHKAIGSLAKLVRIPWKIPKQTSLHKNVGPLSARERNAIYMYMMVFFFVVF